jgi:hypothetical protein
MHPRSRKARAVGSWRLRDSVYRLPFFGSANCDNVEGVNLEPYSQTVRQTLSRLPEGRLHRAQQVTHPEHEFFRPRMGRHQT